MTGFEGCVITRAGGKFEDSASRDMLRQGLEQAAKTDARRVVLFVHGGGWSKAKGIDLARNVRDKIFKGLRFPVAPLYLIWQPTIRNALCNHPPGSGELLGRDLATIEESVAVWLGSLRDDDLDKPAPLLDPLSGPELRDHARAFLLSDRKMRQVLKRQAAHSGSSFEAWLSRFADIMGRVYERRRLGRDHGRETIVEELVRELDRKALAYETWTGMKKMAADHFCGDPASFGAELFTGLKSHGIKRLIVFGHSAGAHLAFALVAATADDPGFDCVIDLVFTAPAVSLKFASAHVGKLKPGSRFRIYRMHDERERTDPLDGTPAGILYRRSMLYFGSALGERDGESEPDAAPAGDALLLGMHRHLSADILPAANLSAAERRWRKTLLAALTDTITTPADRRDVGPRCNAQKHTDFENECRTVGDIKRFFDETPS